MRSQKKKKNQRNKNTHAKRPCAHCLDLECLGDSAECLENLGDSREVFTNRGDSGDGREGRSAGGPSTLSCGLEPAGRSGGLVCGARVGGSRAVLANMLMAAAKFALSLWEGKRGMEAEEEEGEDSFEEEYPDSAEGGEGGRSNGEDRGLTPGPPGGEGLKGGGTRGGLEEGGATLVDDTHPALVSESRDAEGGEALVAKEAYDQGNAAGPSARSCNLAVGKGGDGLFGAFPRGASKEGRRGFDSTDREEEEGVEERANSTGLEGAGWLGGGAVGRGGEEEEDEEEEELLLDLFCAAKDHGNGGEGLSSLRGLVRGALEVGEGGLVVSALGGLLGARLVGGGGLKSLGGKANLSGLEVGVSWCAARNELTELRESRLSWRCGGVSGSSSGGGTSSSSSSP